MIKVTSQGFWMDGYLKSNLDTALYNVTQDFDLVIIVSGSGMVRIGKTVIAGQIGLYAAERLGTPFGVDNYIYSGEELIEKAGKYPMNSVFIYDEARGELDNKKVMEKVTRTLLDFLAECGTYNHVLIFVAPDFFELPKGIAVNRSDFLINVYRSSEPKTLKDGTEVMKYKRGYFEFYNKERKKRLYIMGKKNFDDYSLGKANFWGEFPDTWVVPYEEYQKRKIAFVKRDRNHAKQEKYEQRFTAAVASLCSVISQEKAAEVLKSHGVELTRERLGQISRDYRRSTRENDLEEKGKGILIIPGGSQK